MEKKYIIGIVSPYELEDRRASSGTMYMLLNAIKYQGFCIKKISVDYSYKRSFENRIKKKLYLLLSKIPFVEVDRFNIIGEAKAISDSLSSDDLKNCDVLFFPFESPAMYKKSFDKPVIYLSDATFQAMVNYYYYGYNYSEIKHGNEIEKYALEHSDAILFSSKWAADSAINDYHQDPSKVHVIEFGANIDDKDIIEKKFVYEGHLHLLFLGVDWKRKGGQIAVDACKWLNENGVPATLHIVGIRELDDSVKQLPYIDYVGFLNKNVPEQYSRLVQVIKQCHCMLLPTLAECSAIAFCESSANGLPVFSHLTGGVGNYIYNGRNGYLLPLGSTGADFGVQIKACLESGELERMSVTARDVYREKLNWNVWAQKVEVIIRNILEEKNGRNK